MHPETGNPIHKPDQLTAEQRIEVFYTSARIVILKMNNEKEIFSSGYHPTSPSTEKRDASITKWKE